MNLKLNLIVIPLLLCVVFFKANAQTTEATPSHLQAAEKFLVAVGIGVQFNAISDNIINTFSKQFPEDHRAAFAGVMKKFMDKYYTWDIVKGPMSKIYAAEFDETELNQLTAFYNSPAGKKYSEKLPVLMQKGMLMGQQVMTDHKAEFIEMMKEATKQH